VSKKKAYVALLLDRSGSMNVNKVETISAVSQYIKSLKDNFKGRFTLTQFDSGGIDILTQYNNAKIKELPDFTSFDPRGSTPLLDAIGKTIAEMKTEGYDNVIFVIVTDGEENSSHEYTLEAVRTLLEEKQKLGWQVSYLGANVDAFAVGASLGIRQGQSMNFSGAHAVQVMDAYATSNVRYANRPSVTETATADFTEDERDKSSGGIPG
jgi:Mg-chelatase subunit ChlD